MLTDEQIRNILGMHGALPLKDGATDSIIEGREAILIVAIRAILAAHNAGAQDPEGYFQWDDVRAIYEQVSPMHASDADVVPLYAHPQPITDAARDVLDSSKLIDWLRDETCDLRCINVPTGGDDCDVRWAVIQHHMAEPHEREIGRSFTDEPREAIRDAIERLDRAKGE